MMQILPKLPFAAIIALTLWVAAPDATAAGSAELRCTVSSVHDGDSLRVRCPGNRRSVRVRMEQIDAPELEQARRRHPHNRERSVRPTVGQRVL